MLRDLWMASRGAHHINQRYYNIARPHNWSIGFPPAPSNQTFLPYTPDFRIHHSVTLSFIHILLTARVWCRLRSPSRLPPRLFARVFFFLYFFACIRSEFGLLIKQQLYFDRYTRILAPTLDPLRDARIQMQMKVVEEEGTSTAGPSTLPSEEAGAVVGSGVEESAPP